jgi:hypothetical protein
MRACIACFAAPAQFHCCNLSAADLQPPLSAAVVLLPLLLCSHFSPLCRWNAP